MTNEDEIGSIDSYMQYRSRRSCSYNSTYPR